MLRMLMAAMMAALAACGDKDDADDDCDVASASPGDSGYYYPDADGDGYPDLTADPVSCEYVEGTEYYRGPSLDQGDCDDTDADINPDHAEKCDGVDNDCDGDVDLDDSDLVAGTETCNGYDDDCDGEIDEGVLNTFYADSDGDGYGDPEAIAESCGPPSGYVSDNTDCDDTEEGNMPGGEEICGDGFDNDCDGAVDEDGELQTYFADADGDGYGDSEQSEEACSAPTGYVQEGGDCDDSDGNTYPGAAYAERGDYCMTDSDGDGYGDAAATGATVPGEDCDDSDPLINPDETEVCDEVDNDCDGSVDEDDAADAATWYFDGDGDGYGDPEEGYAMCEPPSWYIADNTDCDDSDSAINPDATEICDEVDNDCDGKIDDDDTSVDTSTGGTWYFDGDGDGYGEATPIMACDQPSGTVVDHDSDCNDADGDTYPGAAYSESATDCMTDSDGDGYGDVAVTGSIVAGTDCDDSDNAINPDATEICDELDNDCDGLTDDEDGSVEFAASDYWYADSDSDGYGDSADLVFGCDQPSGYVDDNTDCDDANAGANPDETEVCDDADVDEDCDGLTDDDDSSVDSSTYSTWYRDADGDGYGELSTSVDYCNEPRGYVAHSGDCNDSDGAINPDATEICDELDNDCNSDIDDDDFGLDTSTATTWYGDADGDGYGDSDDTEIACAAPSGYTDEGGDCDDSDSTANPGETEVCDSVDNDCDSEVDEGLLGTFYEDADGDGHGNPEVSVEECVAPVGYVANSDDCDDTTAAVTTGAIVTYYKDDDSDGYGDDDESISVCGEVEPTGYVLDGGDCDDSDADINPDATEVNNLVDDDCDGDIVVTSFDGAETWYLDPDGENLLAAQDFGQSTGTCSVQDWTVTYSSSGKTDSDLGPYSRSFGSLGNLCSITLPIGSADLEDETSGMEVEFKDTGTLALVCPLRGTGVSGVSYQLGLLLDGDQEDIQDFTHSSTYGWQLIGTAEVTSTGTYWLEVASGDRAGGVNIAACGLVLTL